MVRDMTIYALKPRFQGFLRPLVAGLPRLGINANAVTVAAALGSILAGGLMASFADEPRVFLILPVWLPARMALNAVDGMLARDFHQKSTLGGYLNEIGDVVSDAALYAPLALVAPFGWPGISLLIALSITTELAGAMSPMLGASRRYDGPMGKSDRAVVFGLLGLWIGSSVPLPESLAWGVPILAALLAATIVNRVRGGIVEIENGGTRKC
jgi:CDP-diacylglycerol--glycerol-3-phosphate 3-phosphatidyltransferase